MQWAESQGFLDHVCSTPLSDVTRQLMPSVSDRFHEAVFFAKLAVDQPPDPSVVNQVNWLVGAHLTAFISITDAAENDYKRAGCEFKGSAFHLERLLRIPDDPCAANAACRDIRNLRTHFAEPIVALEPRLHDRDIFDGNADRPKLRWYFRPLKWDSVQRLKKPNLCELDMRRFNNWTANRPMIVVMGQMLFVVEAVLRAAVKDLEKQ